MAMHGACNDNKRNSLDSYVMGHALMLDGRSSALTRNEANKISYTWKTKAEQQTRPGRAELSQTS